MPRQARASNRARYRPQCVPDECIESKTGRHAVDDLGFSVGEVVFVRALVTDALIAPGMNATLLLTVTDPEGHKLDQTIRVEPHELIRSPELGAEPGP